MSVEGYPEPTCAKLQICVMYIQPTAAKLTKKKSGTVSHKLQLPIAYFCL